MDVSRTCGVYEAAWLSRLHSGAAHALYLHVPFCVRKCAYCDFVSWETPRGDALLTEYAKALKAQLAEAVEVGLLSACETAYLGGGTPTLLGAEALGSLVRSVRAAAPRLRELTCEANPESLTDEVLATLREAGATRLSIGVQSLDDAELQALGRIHDAATARDCVTAAIGTGLDVSLDLMCATPHQTDDSWTRTLSESLALGVGHVSVYPLQLEEGTPLARSTGDGEPTWNDPDVQAMRMEAAAKVLGDAGFARYEVASYARPGKACLHNQAYWTGLPYLGLGTGASSMLTRETYVVLRTACPQLPELGTEIRRVRLTCTSDRFWVARARCLADLSFDLEFLDEAQAAAEDLMLGMRRSDGAHPGLLAHARSMLGAARVDGAIDYCLERGLVTWREGRLVPTHRGWLLGNELYGTFWDLAEGEVRTASCL